jgi:UPF0755 protein
MLNLIYKLIGSVIFIGALGTGWGLMEYEQFVDTPLTVRESGFRYEVKSGETLTQVSNALSHAGIISKPKYLIWLARFNGQAHKIKAGEYKIDPGTRPPELIQKLVSGEVIQYSLTLIEGITFREMMVIIADSKDIEHTLKGLNQVRVMSRLGYPKQHPEGRFLPDTYHFPKGTTDVAFLKRAYAAMEETLAQQWSGRVAGLPIKSPYEALILASIIEKETGLASERREIGGVFIRRLEKRMRLQTDPTVIYGLGKKFDGNLRRRDLKKDTPYNTYRRRGLPPTPIAMPGRDSIYAAVNPDDGETLYFVARGDGSHKFTNNLKQHNNAVIKYQLKGRRRAFSSMPLKKKKK